MKDTPYHFEIKDLMVQFVSAFDSIIIKRYNKGKEVKDQIQVRYVYSPKQRVIHDLINRARHITLPVVAVNINSVSRDPTRVFNKIAGSYHPAQTFMAGVSANIPTSNFLPQPVPINIDINMSVLTKFQTDMDQILSNFIPYNDPYIILSWKVPSAFVQTEQEIRSEVLWGGNIALTYPTDLPANSPYRISADTSFTIKGWLFREKTDVTGNIFVVNTYFTPMSSLHGIDILEETESVSLPNANILEQYQNATNLGDGDSVVIDTSSEVTIIFHGQDTETSTITIDSSEFVIGNVDDKLVFDIGGSSEYTFNTVGSTTDILIGEANYRVTYVEPGSNLRTHGSFIFTVTPL